VVWLRAPSEVLATRVGAGGDHRPLLGTDPDANLRRLDDERRPIYQDVADVVIDVAELTPDQAADRIIERLRP
jgi:shikimate kinase